MELDENIDEHFSSINDFFIKYGFLSTVGFISVNIMKLETYRSVSSGNADNTCVKPMNLVDFWGPLIPIGASMFEANRPWADTLSQGIRCQKANT